ncbi:hypothetical protein [Rufibacter sp. XAAS-G3-1]|uniref:hypothetical protein n=1 Tax=Rufibacter sp. XAAS-G3-1 TaxID=2729134 RepID=UPI0015E7DEFB|nr:hypothetical protein [Rufibacter sp. XAAS-G3-1]
MAIHEYLKDEVILITYDEEGGFTFTTDGSTEAHKQKAFNGAQHLVKQLEERGVLEPGGEIRENPNNRFLKERINQICLASTGGECSPEAAISMVKKLVNDAQTPHTQD